MNALSMLWSGRNTILDVHLCKLMGRIFREKWKIKSDRHWMTKCILGYNEVEIPSAPHNAEGVQKGVL